MGEGWSDFYALALLSEPGDDLNATYAMGGYATLQFFGLAENYYYGIRRYPYSLDLHKNPLTFQHIAVPPPTNMPYYNWKGRGPLLSEPHTTGEVFSQALFQCFGNIVAAHTGVDFEMMRARMAQYLVAGLAAFPDHPSLLDGRNAILAAIRIASPGDDYPACRAGFAARGMGADALGPDREFGGLDSSMLPPYNVADVAESFLDRDRALHVASSYTVDAADPTHGAIHLDLRNSGLVDVSSTLIAIAAAVPDAVAFPGADFLSVGKQPPELRTSAAFPVVVTPCLLPAHPTQPGFRALDYTITVSSPDGAELSQQVTFEAAVPAAADCVAAPR
jgi:hypothetical protein